MNSTARRYLDCTLASVTSSCSPGVHFNRMVTVDPSHCFSLEKKKNEQLQLGSYSYNLHSSCVIDAGRPWDGHQFQPTTQTSSILSGKPRTRWVGSPSQPP